MSGYIRANSAWRTLQKGFVYANGAWRTVQKGFLYANGAWRQFFASATTTYTFFLGNTVHIGTNGYISLDSGQDTSSISSTVGRVLGILPADLVTNSIRWAADDSNFYVFYRGRRVAGSDFEIEYEVHFTNGLNYALIKLVAFPADTYSNTAYYFDGSRTGLSAITSARTVGAEYRVYFGATAAFATSFTEFGASTHPVWLASSTPTSGTLGTGYFTIVANQGSSAQAPTGISASSITGTTATVSWTAPSGANSGMSAIQTYDYSIDSGVNWTSTGANTSVNLISLTSNTSYTVLVRANNYFFNPGTNYASVTFTTANVPGTPTITYSSITATGFTATWAATGATTYNVDAFRSVSGAALTDTGGFTYPRNGTSATTATFTGLTGTLSHSMSVAGINSGGTGPTFSKSLAGTPAVTFGTNTTNSTGFTGSISNYDNTYTYTASATNSATVTFGSVSGSTYNFTVSGLAAGASSTVTITAAKATAFNGTGSTTATATVAAPPAPTITLSSISTTGFTATFASTGATSYSVDVFRSATGVSATGYPTTISGSSISPTGLTGTVNYSITAVATNAGGSSSMTTKTITGTPAVTFGSNTSTATGFTGSVSNRDAAYSYSFAASNSATVTPGSASGSSYPFTVSGLSAGASSTVTVTSSKTDAFNGTGSTTGSATAAATPDVSRIDALGLGNTTAPYIRFTFTSTNAASLSIMLYRSATASTGPWTALGARSIQTTSGTRSVDFSSRTGTTSNWYYVDVIPYANSDGTGTAGTLRTSSVKRGNDTTTTRVY